MNEPTAQSAASAVATLRAELEMLDSALDAIDRKAALIPVAVGAIAGLFVGPDTKFTAAQLVAVLPAIITGASAAWIALRVLRTTYLSFGPNAQTAAEATHMPVQYFDRAVAGSLADAIDLMSDVAKKKGERLNQAMSFAGASILLFALARVAGGTA